MRFLSTMYLPMSAAALLWASVNGQDGAVPEDTSTLLIEQQDPNDKTCHVCGEGMIIGIASPIISTQIGMFTCGSLAGAGLLGNIHDCAEAQAVAEARCECMPDGSDGNIPVSAPVESPTTDNAPIQCSVCSDGKVVTILNGTVTIPEFDETRTCADYLMAVLDRNITDTQCEMLQQYSGEPCGCSEPENGINRETLAPEQFVCHVCGANMGVGDPDAIVSIPTQGNKTCGELEAAGQSGSISRQGCALLSSFVRSSCMCSYDAPSVVVPEPTLSPANDYYCNICGDGYAVSNPDGIAFVPTQQDRTCGDYLAAARDRNITELQCGLLQGFTFAPCGCVPAEDTESPTTLTTESPTAYPTQNMNPTPSPAPTPYFTARQGCFDNLAEIYEYESALLDSSLSRKYVLCPGTTFDLGIVNADNRIEGGQPPLMLRPNVLFQCGETGDRANKCVFRGGDFGVTSHYGIYEGVYEAVGNVKIQGITFESQNLMAVVLEAAGDITFLDCAFEMQANKVPVLIQWNGQSPQEARSAGEEEEEEESRRHLTISHNHVVTFKDCMFAHNTVIDDMAFPGIIENSFGSELNIINCLFENNIYGDEGNAAPFGYAIRSFGPLKVEDSCFIDNVFLKAGPVQVFGTTYTTTGNYVESSQTGLDCGFLALFTTQDDTTHDTPTCVQHEELTCGLPTNQPDLTTPETPPSSDTTAETPPQTIVELAKSSCSSRRISISIFAASCILSTISSLL